MKEKIKRKRSVSNSSGEKLLAAEVLRQAIRDAKAGDEDALDFLDPKNELFMFWCSTVLNLDTKDFLAKLAAKLNPEQAVEE